MIYKLYNEYGTYYGSTIQTLKRRLSKHKCDAKTKNCSSKILFQDGSIPKIVLVEEVKFDDIKELREREGYYIRNLDCVNKDIPNRTQEEYKLYYKEYMKQYREANKQYREASNEQAKVKISCECGSLVVKHTIQRHRRSKKHLKYIDQNKSNVII